MSRATKQQVLEIMREAVSEMRFAKETKNWSRYQNIRGIFRMYWRDRHNIVRVS